VAYIQFPFATHEKKMTNITVARRQQRANWSVLEPILFSLRSRLHDSSAGPEKMTQPGSSITRACLELTDIPCLAQGVFVEQHGSFMHSEKFDCYGYSQTF